MTYMNLLTEACGEALPVLLLLPDASLGKLFKTAVSYMAGDPDPVPLPLALQPAWDRLHALLDADVAGCASPRTVFHTLACRRSWYLRALADADAGRLAAGFILGLLGCPAEFPAGPTVRDMQLQSHFSKSLAALQGQLPPALLKMYRKIRTALTQVQPLMELGAEETDYLTGCLCLLQLQELGQTVNGTPVLQDAEQLAALMAARWLLDGGELSKLKVDSHRQAAQEYFAALAKEQQDAASSGPAAEDAPAEGTPPALQAAEPDAKAASSFPLSPEQPQPPAPASDWASAWAAGAGGTLGAGSSSDWS